MSRSRTYGTEDGNNVITKPNSGKYVLANFGTTVYLSNDFGATFSEHSVPIEIDRGLILDDGVFFGHGVGVRYHIDLKTKDVRSYTLFSAESYHYSLSKMYAFKEGVLYESLDKGQSFSKTYNFSHFADRCNGVSLEGTHASVHDGYIMRLSDQQYISRSFPWDAYLFSHDKNFLVSGGKNDFKELRRGDQIVKSLSNSIDYDDSNSILWHTTNQRPRNKIIKTRVGENFAEDPPIMTNSPTTTGIAVSVGGRDIYLIENASYNDRSIYVSNDYGVTFQKRIRHLGDGGVLIATNK